MVNSWESPHSVPFWSVNQRLGSLLALGFGEAGGPLKHDHRRGAFRSRLFLSAGWCEHRQLQHGRCQFRGECHGGRCTEVLPASVKHLIICALSGSMVNCIAGSPESKLGMEHRWCRVLCSWPDPLHRWESCGFSTSVQRQKCCRVRPVYLC